MMKTWMRPVVVAALLLAGTMLSGRAAEEEADGSRLGDGTGSVMTFADLGEVAPQLEASRMPPVPRIQPPPLNTVEVEASAYSSGVPTLSRSDFETVPREYVYLEPSTRPFSFTDREYGPTVMPNRVRVYPGPGMVVILSEHDRWPSHDGGGNAGYWDKGFTITGDPAYMSYYERNFGWGHGMSEYAGPRFDGPRGHHRGRGGRRHR